MLKRNRGSGARRPGSQIRAPAPAPAPAETASAACAQERRRANEAGGRKKVYVTRADRLRRRANVRPLSMRRASCLDRKQSWAVC